MFSSSTTAIEALNDDLSKTPKPELMELSKDVLCDLVIHLAGRQNTPSTDESVLTAIQELQSELNSKFLATEEHITENSARLEELLTTRPNDLVTEALPHEKPGYSVLKNPGSRIETTCDPVEDHKEDFIDGSLSTELLDLCRSLSFTQKPGRAVASFGAEYEYKGSVPPQSVNMPPAIEKLINKVSSEYNLEDSAQPTQCLINKLEGPEAYIPIHSDDEVTISPFSSIYTISIGDTVNVKYTDYHSEKEHEITVNNNSIYVMSKKSQSFWSHQIKKSSNFIGIKYSLSLIHI